VPEAYNIIFKVPAAKNLLESAKALYKCFKPSHNCFKLPEASNTILKVP